MKTILDVGQCDHDHGLLTKLASKLGARTIRATTTKDALEKLGSEEINLIWVNRMLDADNTFGIETIKSIKSNPKFSAIPVMLISNFEQAQTDAIQCGALMGFGKDHLSQPQTIELLQAALGK